MKNEKYSRFSLVLMVSHNCNLRCRYCYSGRKEKNLMNVEVAFKAVERGVNSVREGGVLEISFFGGEPLLEVDLLEKIIEYAKELTIRREIDLKIFLTTNGTILNDKVKALMENPSLIVSVSCDGSPSVHNMNRYDTEQRGSFLSVYKTIKYLQSRGREFTVVSVVTPNNVSQFLDSISYLKSEGVRFIEPNLDVWSRWSDKDILHLESSLKESVEFWWNNIPQLGITWFDEKLLQLNGNYKRDRCRFGNGDITVSPSGKTYPCERLIGDDLTSNPMIIEHDIWNNNDFLTNYDSPERSSGECSVCTMNSICATDCRCSNYIRTGEVNKPDKLLCTKEQVCLTEVLNLYHNDSIKKSQGKIANKNALVHTQKEVDYVKS